MLLGLYLRVIMLSPSLFVFFMVVNRLFPAEVLGVVKIDAVDPIKLVIRDQIALADQFIKDAQLELLILGIDALDHFVYCRHVVQASHPPHQHLAAADLLGNLGVQEVEGATVHQIVGYLDWPSCTFTIIFSISRQCSRLRLRMASLWRGFEVSWWHAGSERAWLKRRDSALQSVKRS